MDDRAYKMLDAIRLLQREFRTAPADMLDAVYQRIASEANDSEYGQTHEPLQGIAAAFHAAQRQRLLKKGG